MAKKGDRDKASQKPSKSEWGKRASGHPKKSGGKRKLYEEIGRGDRPVTPKPEPDD